MDDKEKVGMKEGRGRREGNIKGRKRVRKEYTSGKL